MTRPVLAPEPTQGEEDATPGPPAPATDPTPARRRKPRKPLPGYPGISTIERKKGIVYEARWRANGTSYSATFPNLKEAKAHLIAQRHAVQRGDFIPPAAGRTTWGELFVRRQESRRIKGRKEDTLAGYQNIADTWLAEWWDRPIASIRLADVQKVLGRLHADERKPQTIHNVYGVIHGVFRYAVLQRCLTSSPIEDLRSELLPPPGRTKEPNPLAKAELDELIGYLPDRDRLLVLFTAWSGLRAAELVGLRVQDVRVMHAEAYVSRTVKRAKGTVRVGQPKSRKSTGRTVPIPPTLARQVAAHVAALGLGPDDYVFPDIDGGPLRYSSWYHRVWIPARRRFGRPALRFHDLRHTFAALKLAQGKGLHELKEWMGHSTINVTVDLYGSWVRGDEEARRREDDAAFLAGGSLLAKYTTVELGSRATGLS